MDSFVVTFEQLVERFPRISCKSRILAGKVLPLCSSPELAGLVAALMSDGHIEWHASDGNPRAKKIILYSSHKPDCEWFLSVVERLFGVKGKLQAYLPNHNNWKKQPFKAVVHSAVVASILILAGTPAGNKTKRGFLIPGWIINGTSEIKKEFLRVFFSFEAGMPSRKTNRENCFQIALFMNKDPPVLKSGIRFMNQIIRLLLFFGVSCSKVTCRQCSGTFNSTKKTIYFSISSQMSIINFYHNIGFLNSFKQTRLKSCVLRLSKFHRIKSPIIARELSKLKEKTGTDSDFTVLINEFSETNFTVRQIEHFRRKESAIPLEIVWAMLKIKKSDDILAELPAYVRELRPLV